MSAECDALRNELNRISKQIAALDGKYLLKSEKPVILNESESRFKSLFPVLFGGLFVGAFQQQAGPLFSGVADNKISAELAKAAARLADGKATQGLTAAQAAKQLGTTAKVLGETNRTAIKTVNGVATAAKTASATATSVANAANAKAVGALSKAGSAAKQAITATKLGTKAFNTASSVASKLAPLAAGLAKVLGIVGTIFSILQTVAFAYQIASLLTRVARIEKLIYTITDPIYRLLGINQAEIRRVQRNVGVLERRIEGVSATANSARNRADTAQNSATEALRAALNAIALVSGLLYLKELVPKVQVTAQRALTRTLKPGPSGKPGIAGKNGLRGLQGLRGLPGIRGLSGLRGLPGLRGRPGKDGRSGKNGAPGLRGQQGLQGVRGQNGRPGIQGRPGKDAEENPVNNALLRKIDATTTQDLAVDRKNQALITAQNAVILQNLSVAKQNNLAIKKNGAGIGLERFPAVVPGSLNSNVSGSSTIENLADLHVWQAKNLDSLMGVWPAKMAVDANGISTEVEMNTTSDMLQELYGMTLALTIGQGIQTQLATKNLIETGATKTQALLGKQYAAANAEFLGYEGNRSTTQMPLAFSPGKDLLDGLLTEGTTPVPGWQNSQRDTLGTKLNELLQAAAIIKAVFYRKVDTGDLKGSIRGNIDVQGEFSTRDQANEDQKGDWAAYLQSIEKGFGLSEPYGRGATEGPNIVDHSSP